MVDGRILSQTIRRQLLGPALSVVLGTGCGFLQLRDLDPQPPDPTPVAECGLLDPGASSGTTVPMGANLNPIAECNFRGAPVQIYRDTDPTLRTGLFYSPPFLPILPATVAPPIKDPTGSTVRIDLKMQLSPPELVEACQGRLSDPALPAARPLPLLYSSLALQAPVQSTSCSLREKGSLHYFGDRETLWIRTISNNYARALVDDLNRTGAQVRSGFGVAGVRTRTTCEARLTRAQSATYDFAVNQLRSGDRILSADGPEWVDDRAFVVTETGMNRLKASVQNTMGISITQRDGAPCPREVESGFFEDLVARDVADLASTDKLEKLLASVWSYSHQERECAAKIKSHVGKLRELALHGDAKAKADLSSIPLIGKYLPSFSIGGGASYKNTTTSDRDVEQCLKSGFQLHVASKWSTALRDTRVLNLNSAWSTVEAHERSIRGTVDYSPTAPPGPLVVRLTRIVAPPGVATCAGAAPCPVSLQSWTQGQELWTPRSGAPVVADNHQQQIAGTMIMDSAKRPGGGSQLYSYQVNWDVTTGTPRDVLVGYGVDIKAHLVTPQPVLAFDCRIRPKDADVVARMSNSVSSSAELLERCSNGWGVYYTLRPVGM